jgi:LemA protein
LSVGQIVSLGAAALLLFWGIGAHTRLIALRNAIGVAWAQLDALLQRRGALLATLLPSLRGQLPDEQRALDALTAAAGQVDACAMAVRARPSAAPAVASLAMAEAMFAGAATRLLAIVEQHAAPAAHAEVAPAVAELRELEGKVAFARQWFNEAVGAYHEAVREFPTRVLSRLFGLRVAGRL